MEMMMRARRKNARHGHSITVAAEGSRGGEYSGGDLLVSMVGCGSCGGGDGCGLNGHGEW